jgi:hypothetical protein
MTSAARPILAFSIIVVFVGSGLGSAQAQSRAQVRAASAAPQLDLSTSTATAVGAAKAAQAAPSPPVPSTDTVDPLTVRPETRPQGKVVASTDAASLSSPDFSAKDAEGRPLAISIGQNTALGQQSVDNTQPGGFLQVNPDVAGGETRGDVGVTSVF